FQTGFTGSRIPQPDGVVVAGGKHPPVRPEGDPIDGPPGAGGGGAGGLSRFHVPTPKPGVGGSPGPGAAGGPTRVGCRCSSDGKSRQFFPCNHIPQEDRVNDWRGLPRVVKGDGQRLSVGAE